MCQWLLQVPPKAYYVPNFVSETEENELLKQVSLSPNSIGIKDEFSLIFHYCINEYSCVLEKGCIYVCIQVCMYVRY